MIKIDYVKEAIDRKLIADNKKRDKEHVSSGKLSAGSLGSPLQHQILHTIGVPKEPLTAYTLAKFKRGNHVEDWLRSVMPDFKEKEKFVEYKNTVGYIDALIDMTDWGIPNVTGIIPHEIKSVTSAGFKWIKRDGYKKGHALQSTLYALAEGVDWYVIDYVASDDYRVLSFLERTDKHAGEVEAVIDEYNKQLAKGEVPVFEAKEKWQLDPKYNSYSRFMELDEKEIETLLKKDYVESYKKLKEVLKE